MNCMNYIPVGYKCFKNNDNLNKHVFAKTVLHNLVCIFWYLYQYLRKKEFLLQKKKQFGSIPHLP